ncbi:hypothetical protein D3C78_1963820 [compost metagenome]
MKIYIAQEQLQMVGKAWEIRHHLRQLGKGHSGQPSLHAVLQARTSSPKHPKTP